MYIAYVDLIKILLHLRTFIDTLKAIARKLSLPQREREIYIYIFFGEEGVRGTSPRIHLTLKTTMIFNIHINSYIHRYNKYVLIQVGPLPAKG